MVWGPTRLSGQVMVSAAKNAILPILAASMLSSGTVVIKKVPAIRDVHIMMALIQQMGLEVEHAEGILTIKGTPQNILPDYDLSRQIRASFLLMGPLLARCGQAKAFLPGGCAIGTRPVDLHLKGFEALGAAIQITGGCVTFCPRLQGNYVYLDFPSVGATENIMMAAALAQGTTYIEMPLLNRKWWIWPLLSTAWSGSVQPEASYKIEGVAGLGDAYSDSRPHRNRHLYGMRPAAGR